MLTSGFFNLATSKKSPVIHIDHEFGGVRFIFTDDVGDELQVVLSADSFEEMLRGGSAFREGIKEWKSM